LTPPAVAHACTRSGQWLTARGVRLDAGRRVAVVIEPIEQEPASQLMLAAYGLSNREREVALLSLRGLSSMDIAEALHLSEYTVQDHFKSIFDKTGFSTRKELAARLYLPTTPLAPLAEVYPSLAR